MSPPHVIYSKASHRPSDPMISSRPLIGQFPPPLSPPTYPPTPPPKFLPNLFLAKSPFGGGSGKTKIGPTIRIGQDILCLMYAGFFICIQTFVTFQIPNFSSNLSRLVRLSFVIFYISNLDKTFKESVS